jgi:Eco29kI restriction endonuclease
MTEERPSIAAALKEIIARISEKQDTLTGARGRRRREELEGLTDELQARLATLDPIQHPDSFFDPADPRLFGIFAALALIGLDRVPLESVEQKRFYGSGVYALYYTGDFKTYRPISRTEHPIYVGKADPEQIHARSPRQQGEKLCGRLNEHRKNIDRAENLELSDFECRYLVVASGWQTAAESALIGLFKPVWNKEMRILLGFGKHGDSAETRRNRRSPWDVLHAGRQWAAAEKYAASMVEDSKSVEEINQEVGEHFKANKPVTDIQHIVKELIAQVRTVEAT